MAALTEQERQELWQEWMADLSNNRESVSVTKADLRAALDALDTWVEANQATINSTIPQPARGALSVAQKAKLMMFILTKRYRVI